MVPYKYLILSLLLITVFSVCSYAYDGPPLPASGHVVVYTPRIRNLATDTIPGKKTDPPQTDDPGNKQAAPGKAGIKEVPKAKKQIRPQTIDAATVRVRPVKIIKPKIVAKGVGK